MPVQLYLDEDVDPLLAQVLRTRGINYLSTQEAHHCGKSDTEQLTFAVSKQRSFLTFNVKDFVLLSQKYAVTERTHSGIILSKHLPFQELLRRTLLLVQKHGHEEFTNQVLWLQDFQRSSKESQEGFLPLCWQNIRLLAGNTLNQITRIPKDLC